MNYTPKLIEHGVRNYMQGILNKCSEHKTRLYTIVLNGIVLILFLGGLGLILWYCSKKKLSPEEKRRKMLRDQEYILTKIREFQSQKQIQQEQISQLSKRVLPIESDDDYKNMLNHTEQTPSDIIYSMAMHETRRGN
jgi:hypothetical protein